MERLRRVRVSGGDYLPGDLDRAVDNRYLMANVATETLRLAAGRSKVVFAGSVLHSQKLAAAFRRRGIKAVHLDGETPSVDRETMLDDLRDGRIEMICNYDVLSEGWDLPDLGCVVLARPFRSLTRYLRRYSPNNSAVSAHALAGTLYPMRRARHALPPWLASAGPGLWRQRSAVWPVARR